MKAQSGWAGIAGILILIIAIVTVAAVIGVGHIGSAAPVSAPQNSSPLIGGTATSLQNVQFVSNYAGISGAGFLTTFTINGKGQAYSGTTQSTASGINSSYTSSVNNPVSITYALNSEKLQIPYTWSGADIYKWSAQVVNPSYSFNSCPFGVSCQQSTSGSGVYNFAAAAIGIPYQTVSLATQGFANSCYNLGSGATAVMLSAASTSIAGIGGYGVEMECARPQETNWGSVYTAGNGNLAINASVTYSNGTATHTIYLTNTKDSGYYSNILYAQIYSYSSSGSGLLTATAPMLTIAANGTKILSPSSSISSVIDTIYNQFPQSWLTSYQSIGGYTLSNVYEASNLYGGINATNTNLNDLLYPLQPTNPYYNMQIASGTTIGTIDATSAPLYYPEVQLIAKVSTLSVVVPVAHPIIQSVSLNPPTLTSGSSTTATVSVYNNGTATASVGLSAACGSQTYSGQTISIGAHQTGSGTIILTSLDNPNLANEELTCVATATSSSYGLFSSSKSFSMTITPNCPSGYVYVNNQDCQPESSQGNLTTTVQGGSSGTCVAGYSYNDTLNACVPVSKCPTGYILNYSTTPPVCNQEVSTGWPLWEVLAIMAVIIAVIVVAAYAWSRR